MKRVCIIFLLSIIISLTTFVLANPTPALREEDRYLRIHVRADSNESEAQAVKYAVKDRVVEYLTPFIAEYENKQEAEQGIVAHLQKIEEIASQVLAEKGFSYGAVASVERESFPLRKYEEYTLPAGEYTALILRLGSGKGDNWWCVVYPPLCFSATTKNVVYKSKIQEIIRSFYK